MSEEKELAHNCHVAEYTSSTNGRLLEETRFSLMQIAIDLAITPQKTGDFKELLSHADNAVTLYKKLAAAIAIAES